jgi:hypothetical protein
MPSHEPATTRAPKDASVPFWTGVHWAEVLTFDTSNEKLRM